ncbi:Fc receptor-like protein 3 [Rhynchocyon petersi]
MPAYSEDQKGFRVCFGSLTLCGSHRRAIPAQVSMFLWLLLLILGIAPKAVLLLDPPWSPVFKGETVTLTCKIFHTSTSGDTSWYHGESLLKEKHEKIKTKIPGEYKCQTRGSSLSDPVHVVFSSGELILQASYPIFEGDYVYLRCKGKQDDDITERSYYKDGKELDLQNKNAQFLLVYAAQRDNKLFTTPKLIVNPSKPIEGNPVALQCETQLPPRKSKTPLRFYFFREGQTLEKGWSMGPVIQIPTMWSEDSGSYWCEAQAIIPNIRKQSVQSQIRVQRIPVSDVKLEIRSPGEQVIEGEDLALVCSVAQGTGTITFSWFREGSVSLGKKSERSSWAELQVSDVKEHDAGRYYCTADNIHGPIRSNWVVLTVKVPVSCPVLTLRTPRAQAVVGDMMELHCETQRGSPPILYRFYQENITLGNISVTSGGVSFNLSLTSEHSGNYYCEADNGLRAQHSHRATLNVIVPVSRPVLTFKNAWSMVELHCVAQKGSPPILYQFYHENVTLGNSLALSEEGATFSISLTAEHSGNYFCDASNGPEAQRSEMVTIDVIGLSRNRKHHITAGVIGGLFSILVLAALLYYVRTQRKPGGIAVTATRPNEFPELSLARHSDTDPQEPSYSNSLALEEMHPVYSNVNPEDSNLLYSEVVSIQHAKRNSGTYCLCFHPGTPSHLFRAEEGTHKGLPRTGRQ